MKYILFLILVSLITLPSCGGKEMTGPTQVYKLQVLSIRANKPEVHAGTEIEVSTLIGIPTNYVKKYTKLWAACDPKSATGQLGLLECMKNSGDNIFKQGFDNKFKFKIPQETLIAYNLKRKDIYVTLIVCEENPELSCMDALIEALKAGKGLDSLDKDRFLFSYKRISVISDEEEITNFNPKIDKIYLNNNELESNNITLTPRKSLSEDNSKDNVFKVAVTEDSFNKVKNAKDEFEDENITIAFRSNNGEFQKYLTNPKKGDKLIDLDEVEHKSAVGKDSYKIYITAMDQKGGADWKVLTVNKNE